jgi:WhiB family redox-sensing transcriptional regulator
MTATAQLTGALSTTWQQQGLCRASDSAVFFAPLAFEHKAAREAREAKAKAICATCPVRTPCLEWALAVREPYGVWGGYGELERKQLLLGKRIAS